MTTLRGGSEWFTFRCSVPTVKARQSSRLASKPTGPNAISCQNEQCTRRIFLLQYQDRGRAPEIRRQVVDMAINGSGIRDTARVLRISPTTVIAVLKKSRRASHTSTPRCYPLLVHALSASRQDAPPSSMKCGVSSAPKRLHGGCGMRSIITQGECLPMWWAPGRMRCS